MKASITKASELDPEQVELWRKWQQSNPALSTPYLSIELFQTMSRYYEPSRVAVLEVENKTVGFLPFDVKGRRIGHTKGVIADPDLITDSAELMQACNLAVLEYDYLVSGQETLFQPKQSHHESAPVFDLSEGWQSWIEKKRKSSSAVKKILQKHRKLARELGELDFALRSHSHADLEMLMDWKAAQFVRTGRADRFSRPWFREALHELIDQDSPHFTTYLSTLYAGTRPVGLYLSVGSGSTVAGWFPTYDVDLASYSPGMSLMMEHAQAASAVGITKIEQGRGYADYKEVLKDYDEYVVEGRSERPAFATYARRARMAPGRAAEKIVLSNPRLRTAARSALNYVGRARMALAARSRTA